MIKTPILLIIFNRPDKVKKMVETLAKFKPTKLYVAADGPRANRPSDLEKTKQAREMLKLIDWECDVKTRFQDQNLGCGLNPAGAISWFFENETKGIILEDDCMPSASFFEFMETMLDRYENDSRVMTISGNNFNQGKWYGNGKYYFNRIPFTWGWATWKRAWEKYDYSISDYAQLKEQDFLEKIFPGRELMKRFWYSKFDHVKDAPDDIWDYQWCFANFKHQALNIVPNRNLVTNVGFDHDATHTVDINAERSIPVGELLPPYEPVAVEYTIAADINSFKYVYDLEVRRSRIFMRKAKTLLKLLVRKSKSLVKKVLRVGTTPQWDYFPKTERQRISKINRFKQIEVMTKQNRPFVVPDAASFLFMSEEIFGKDIYQFKTKTPQPLILDGGANIGVSVAYFKHRYPDAKIIAFEPDFKIAEILKQNIQNLELANVEVVQAALWDKQGTISFFHEGADGNRIEMDAQAINSYEVPTIKLSDYLDQPVDFLKLDIEGAETVVLKEIEAKLSNVQNMFIEYHSYKDREQGLDEILSILRRSGFRYYITFIGWSQELPFQQITEYNGIDNLINICAIRS